MHSVRARLFLELYHHSSQGFYKHDPPRFAQSRHPSSAWECAFSLLGLGLEFLLGPSTRCLPPTLSRKEFLIFRLPKVEATQVPRPVALAGKVASRFWQLHHLIYFVHQLYSRPFAARRRPPKTKPHKFPQKFSGF